MSSPWRVWLMGAVCFAMVFAGHLTAVLFLANDYDDDGVVYARMAQNLVEHGTFSQQSEPPYRPTLVRMPGYPLFLAAVFKLCGVNHLTPVRVAQAFVHTVTVVLLAWLAALWEPRANRRRLAALTAFALAAVCPFTVIYAACILTETLTIFCVVALVLCATLAWLRTGRARAGWWVLAGVCAGLAELQRPDAGLFAAAVGLTLVAGYLYRARADWKVAVAGLGTTLKLGLFFTGGFVLMVTPWIIRNGVVFHHPQLLPPEDCTEPGDFVAVGYFDWFGTWSDDEVDLPGFAWMIGPDQPMKFADLPSRAFDNADEKRRVAALFAEYNTHQPPVMMTPSLDARFGQIARERLARHPWRSHLWLPLRRGINLWFCTHTQYYDCEGHLFPLDQPADGGHQVGWLLFFAGATGFYTIMGVAGAGALLRARGESWRWLCLIVLLIGLRMALLVRLFHTEPRYTVEFFPFLCVLGGLAAVDLGEWLRAPKRLWNFSVSQSLRDRQL